MSKRNDEFLAAYNRLDNYLQTLVKCKGHVNMISYLERILPEKESAECKTVRQFKNTIESHGVNPSLKKPEVPKEWINWVFKRLDWCQKHKQQIAPQLQNLLDAKTPEKKKSISANEKKMSASPNQQKPNTSTNQKKPNFSTKVPPSEDKKQSLGNSRNSAPSKAHAPNLAPSHHAPARPKNISFYGFEAERCIKIMRRKGVTRKLGSEISLERAIARGLSIESKFDLDCLALKYGLKGASLFESKESLINRIAKHMVVNIPQYEIAYLMTL